MSLQPAVVRALGVPWVRALGLVHGGGVAVLVLATLVESATLPAGNVVEQLSRQVPRAWALLAAPLAVVASSLAMHRLREQGALLALGSLGLRPRAWAGMALVLGLVCGIFAEATGNITLETTEILRAAGGWFVRGTWVPDLAGGVATAARRDPQWSGVAALVAAASLLGSGMRGLSPVLLSSAAVLVADLVRRSFGEAAWGCAAIVVVVALAALRPARN